MKYGGHKSKKNIVRLSRKRDVGYELTTHLLVNAQTDSPIAPYEMHMRTAEKVHATREGGVEDMPHLEPSLPTMDASNDWNLPAKIVHVIDREAGSTPLAQGCRQEAMHSRRGDCLALRVPSW